MQFWQNKRKRKIFLWCTSILAVLLIVAGAFAIYVGDYYRADLGAIEAFEVENDVKAQTWEDGTIVYAPENAVTGLIFYPGGKVEYTAYVPLMRACASRGILCVLVEMPMNLAVFDVNAADGIREQFPTIEHWYIGGHSLGGSMAASYLKKHADAFDGLILLASYSTADLSKSDLRVLSVYGSEDGVLNLEKYKKYKKNLPDDFAEVVIEGGCHAYFGMYGEQKGDGRATITHTEQIAQTVEAIVELTGGTS